METLHAAAPTTSGRYRHLVRTVHEQVHDTVPLTGEVPHHPEDQEMADLNRAIPVDQAGLTFKLDSIEPRLDREGKNKSTFEGIPESSVTAIVKEAGTRASVVTVTVPTPAVAADLSEGQAVQFTRLVARPWIRDGRGGVTHQADMVTSARFPATGNEKAGR